MNKERLLALVALLESNPRVRAHFDMSLWCVGSQSCETAACAYGWYCELGPDDRTSKLRGYQPQLTYMPENEIQLPRGLHAAEFEFEINERDAWRLFSDKAYSDATPDTVASRIKEFVNDTVPRGE